MNTAADTLPAVSPIYRPGSKRRVIIAWAVNWPAGGRTFVATESAALALAASYDLSAPE